MVVSDGILTYTPVTPTVNGNIQYHKGINAKKADYIHVVLNSHSKNTVWLTVEFRNPDAVLNSVPIDPDTEGFVTYDIKLAGKKGWSGVVEDIRVRVSTKNKEIFTNIKDYYEFDRIVFDNNPTLEN